MSIKITCKDKRWVEYVDAYFKINSVYLNKRKDTWDFVINFRYFIYNWTVLEENMIDNGMFTDIPVDITWNIFEQAYNYIKTLPKFTESTDI